MNDDLEAYKMEGTVLTMETTMHATGGEAVNAHIGTWNADRVIGEGGSSMVLLQRHATTGVLRAVKVLRTGNDREIRQELSCFLLLKEVGFAESTTGRDRKQPANRGDICSTEGSSLSFTPGIKSIARSSRWSICPAAI